MPPTGVPQELRDLKKAAQFFARDPTRGSWGSPLRSVRRMERFCAARPLPEVKRAMEERRGHISRSAAEGAHAAIARVLP